MGIHADPSAVRELAYRIWMEHGCPPGSAEADWFEAEQKLGQQAGDAGGQAAGGALERANVVLAAAPEQATQAGSDPMKPEPQPVGPGSGQKARRRS